MTGQTDRLLKFVTSSFRPPARIRPSEWASNRVRIADGLTPMFDIANAPWLREPLDSLGDNEAREIVLLAPVGTGKTTMMEAGAAYCIAEDPGPMLIVGQTDEDLRDWAETRLSYALKNTPDTASLFPSDRHKIRKMEILFPHMSLFMTGANLSGLQSKSMRRVWNDEAWQYRSGMLKESRGRLHDRWNRQFFIMSQAGVEGEDLDEAWKQTDCAEYSYPCPGCGTVQPWTMAKVKWDEVMAGESVDRVASAQTSRLICANPGCDHVIPDNPQRRREIAEASKYVPTKEAYPGHRGFHYTVLCNWRKPLWEIVLEWMDANIALKKGAVDPLRQFIQKRLAEPWKPDLMDEKPPLIVGDYTMASLADGESIDDEAVLRTGERARFMFVDVQADHFWAAARAFRPDGSSKLIWCGKIHTEEIIVGQSARLGIPARNVLIDVGYEGTKIYDLCVRHGWLGVKGEGQRDSFPHRDKKTGKQVDKIYSPVKRALAPSGGYASYVYVATGPMKDLLHRLRSGQGIAWEVPSDVPTWYAEHMDGEKKRERILPNGQSAYRWERVGRKDNHIWDCEVGLTAAAVWHRLFRVD